MGSVCKGIMASEEKKVDKTDNNSTKKVLNNKKPDWKKDKCVYTSCYCEENVWNLCDLTRKEGRNLDDYFVIFLSNDSKQFPIWYASLASSNEDPLIWDYHVIFLWINRKEPKRSLIFDLDSSLSFPTEINEYFMKSFQPNMILKEEFKHNYRVIPSKVYLDEFYSDRKHMIKDGKWLSSPPQYDCIMINDKKKGSNLMSTFVNMNSKKIGKIYKDTMELLAWITKSS